MLGMEYFIVKYWNMRLHLTQSNALCADALWLLLTAAAKATMPSHHSLQGAATVLLKQKMKHLPSGTCTELQKRT